MITETSKIEKTPLNPEECELNGISIVEAGAGTGKTYTIQKLILRVLLEKKVPLPQILVVTFTVDATGELLERLHAILQLTRDALEEDRSAKEICADRQYAQISGILEKLQIGNRANREECLRLIRDALQDYDQAAVMTIHGFCQRMLMDNALQSLIRYGVEMRPDYSSVELKIAMDFCRKVLYSPNASESDFGFNLDPATLLNNMKSALSNDFNRTEIKFAEVEKIDKDTANIWIKNLKTPAFWNPLRQIPNESLKADGTKFLREHLAASFSILADQIEAAIDAEATNGRDKTGYLLLMAQKLSRNAFSVYLKKRANEALSTDAAFIPFFEMIDNILKLIRQAETVIGKEFLDFYKQELEKYKAKEGFLTFNDLISLMAEMVESPNGQSLCENIRRTFSYVFVDEFQDTDPEQYCIFSRLFGEGTNRGFFMIGDPKQAIYSFRGGDVYAYLSAIRENPEQRHFYTLTRNYRSGNKYIDALNEFYTKQDDPFNNPDIRFSKIEYGGNVKENLIYGSDAVKMPLQFCQLHDQEDIIRWTVAKIQELLFSNNYFIGEEGGEKKPVSAKDIAILFPTKRFGGKLEKALNAKDINTVWLSESNIFQLPEALLLWRFLEMLYGGVRHRDMIAVLSDGLFMFTAKEIQKVLQPDSPAGIQVQQYFLDLRKIWENKGIHAMFRELLDVPNAKGRPWLEQVRDENEDGAGDRFQDNATLAVHIFQSDPTDGPYILGHIRQLVDKLHTAARKRQLTPGGLLVYLRGMINQENHQEDNGLAQNVQRNTDSSAVRLITLHKSKGLEFPIVLLPNVPTHQNTSVVNRLYHDPSGRRIVDMTGWLSDDKLPDNTAPEQEFLEEKLRLLYVGLTRAKYACYVPYNIDSSKAYKNVINKLSSTLLDFSVKDEPVSYATPQLSPTENAAESRKFEGSFVFDWQAGSFSSFNKGFHLDPAAADVDPGTLLTDVSGGDDEDEKEDVDSADGKTGAENGKKEEKDPASLPKDEEQKAIFSFAGGQEAGTIWHELFELMEFHPEGLSEDADFSPDADMMLLEKLPGKSLYSAIRRRKDKDEETPKLDKAFARMLKGILCNPLTGKTETLFLKDIPQQQCARELRFLYVLKSSVSLKQVKECLERYGIRTGSWASSAETERTDWALTGSLDLLCQSQSGKYYVIDWKTNRRNGKLSDFSAAGVEQEVISNMYSLQYLIYTVALWHFIHERLGIELTPENYDRYFGGVFYLFVRGMAAPLPEMTPEQKEICCKRGIFYTLPQYKLLEEFKGLLDIRPQTNGTERN